MADNFYLTIPSNSYDFKTNTTSEFRVNLPNPIDLDGPWELALVGLQYPFSWNNVKGGLHPVYPDNWILITLAQPNPYKYEHHIEVDIAPAYYSDVHSLIGAIRTALEDWRPLYGGKSMHSSFLPDHCQIMYDEISKRMQVKLDTKVIKGLICSKTIQSLLGFGGRRSFAFIHRSKTGSYPPDLSDAFQTLYLYCDLIQPQIVGDCLAPLLRTVPIAGSHGGTVGEVFLDPHYLPLRCNTFDSIQISIKDDSNFPIKFYFGKSIVKLHLRRKRP